MSFVGVMCRMENKIDVDCKALMILLRSLLAVDGSELHLKKSLIYGQQQERLYVGAGGKSPKPHSYSH